VAELVDAPDLGSGTARRGSSSLPWGTMILRVVSSVGTSVSFTPRMSAVRARHDPPFIGFIMFLKLTNAAPDYKGMPLAVRSDIVLSVFQTTLNRGTEDAPSQESVTVVYSPQASWEVEETVDQVVEQLNKF
jgi:hypothetical protein